MENGLLFGVWVGREGEVVGPCCCCRSDEERLLISILLSRRRKDISGRNGNDSVEIEFGDRLGEVGSVFHQWTR